MGYLISLHVFPLDKILFTRGGGMVTLYWTKNIAPCIKYVQYRLRDVGQRVSPSLYRTPSARFAHSQPVPHTLSPFCTLSAGTAHPQPVQHTLSLYSTPSTCTAHLQPVLHTLSPYCTPLARTTHLQPVLLTFSLYCTPSARSAHPQPVLHTLSLYCTPQPVLHTLSLHFGCASLSPYCTPSSTYFMQGAFNQEYTKNMRSRTLNVIGFYLLTGNAAYKLFSAKSFLLR